MSEFTFKAGETYRTRGGLRARVYATDGGMGDRIHGAIFYGSKWEAWQWVGDGHESLGYESPADLIPNKRGWWVNVYGRTCDSIHTSLHTSREIADSYNDSNVYRRFACVYIEEGDGLE